MKQLNRAILVMAVCALGGTQVALADAPPSKPGNPLIRFYAGSGGELTWQRSTDDRGVRGYEVTKNDRSLGILDVLSVYDESLLSNAPYTFTVTAIDSAGQRSPVATVSTSDEPANTTYTNTTASSDTASTSTGTGTPSTGTETASTFTDRQPEPPAGLRSSVYSSTTAELFWERLAGSAGVRYEVSRNGRRLATTAGISFFDDALTADGLYSYDVVTIDANGLRSEPANIALQTQVLPVAGPDQLPTEQTDSTILTLIQQLPDRNSVFGTDITIFPEPTSRDEEGSLYWEYDIVGNQLSSPMMEPPLAHQRAWLHFSTVIPLARRARLLKVNFVIGQDSAASSTATMFYVFARQVGNGTATLTLYEGLVAAYGEGPAVNTDEFRSKEYIYIHEYAHLLSYIDAAIPTPESIHKAPAETALWPPVLGVPADSVFGRFILRFWRSELIDLLYSTPASGITDIAYASYPERFVTRYAATNYDEDFAESFSYFIVLNDQPEAGSFPGSDKVRFFWEEPDLVSLRDEIRTALLNSR